MTKIFNAIIVVLMIALIATFIVSAVSLQSKTDKILSTYAARREELSTRQQQIQDMIVSLNSTLQTEVIKQQVIATQLGIKVNNTAITPSANSVLTPPPAVVSQPTPIVSTPVPQPVVTPPPVTMPTRRTRAS